MPHSVQLGYVDPSRNGSFDSKEEYNPYDSSAVIVVEYNPYKIEEGLSNQSILKNEEEYPEGGLQAWLTVAGAWLILFSTFGYLYSFGVYQDFYTRFYLSNHTPSQIGWIGSIQFMMPFLMAIVAGPLFDRGHFHALEITGALIYAFSLFMLSLAKPSQYYQIFLSQGVGMGLGLGFTFMPSVSIVTHYFQKRRALAGGVALSGSAVGGLTFPIMLNHLLPTHSFGDSVRASGYVVVGCLILGNALMRTRLPPQTKEPPRIREFFREPAFLTTMMVAVIAHFAVTFPVFYMQLYAVTQRIDSNLAFYTLTIINGASFFGRVIANYMADKLGPFNVIVPTLMATGLSIWLMLAIKSAATLVVVSIIYGFFSGAYLSLAVAVCASLAKRPSDIGAKSGLIISTASLSTLASAPIAGQLLTDEFHWIRPIAFSATFVIVASLIAIVGRFLVAKERGRWNV